MRALFAVLAVALFAALLLGVVLDHTYALKTHDLLFYGGLTSLAAAVIWTPVYVGYRRRRTY